MKSLHKLLKKISLIALTLSTTYAQANELKCSDPRGQHTIIVGKSTMKIISSKNIRDIASIKNVRTKLTANGFTKSALSKGLKHIVHVENIESPNSLNDYMIIRNSKGHEITYPLECQ